MATNLAIDPLMLATALEVGGLRTKAATVELALKEFIQRRRTARILDLFGTIDYEDDYDYKQARQR